ncbi:hypothetical protein MSAN_00467100 [Mycena sanguinolenta]|uniref:Transmembrane protein n=1 Tax=Mycena sanguinolenta TaxID=230812 RepID=A0A8H7DHM9_9AGAR|nr:hypothetical protein MSAN_00467100 [Mycena sanguinolenta]
MDTPPSAELDLKRKAALQGEDATDTLLEFTANPLSMKRQVSRTPWNTTTTLRILAVFLHSLLIAAHLVLIVVWGRGLEHRITVALDHQKIMSYVVSTTTTTFGTVYSAVLVFVTQKLSTRHSLQRYQPLTVTHDDAKAWGGIGAAIALLWNQTKFPGASIMGVLSASIYLAAVLGLHIASSSLFSLVAFNSTSIYHAGTQGLPAFNGTPDLSAVVDMDTYAGGSLPFLPSTVVSESNQGLQGGTLYDVLDTSTAAPGNATVDATGFNITCGFLATPTPLIFSDANNGYSWNMSTTNGSVAPVITSTQPGMISTAAVIVPQVAVVNSQTNRLGTLEPDFTKTVSQWVPYTAVPEADLEDLSFPNVTGNLLINLWQMWYQSLPHSNFPLDFDSPGTTASVADIYLIQKLNLPAANRDDTQSITLHDLENALSSLVATVFWTLGHTIPPYRSMGNVVGPFNNGTASVALNDIPAVPTFVPGNAIVTEVYTAARLELSIIAISGGLVVSVVLMVVSLPLLRGRGSSKHPPIDSTGMLHAIWLYRNHPDLQQMMEQVEHPTDENLRAAGMISTRLVGHGAHDEDLSTELESLVYR